MNLYLTKAGRLRRKDNTLSFEMINIPEEKLLSETESDELGYMNPDSKHALPIETIDAIYVFGEMTFNSKLVNFLGQKRIPVHFFNYYGNHSNTLLPHAEQLSGDLVIRQGKAYDNQTKRLEIARALIEATSHNIISIMQYYKRKKKCGETEIQQITDLKESLSECQSTDEMMGVEGNIRKIYYSAWHGWLGLPAENFHRVYRPPDNPLNAMISFLNSMLYTACVGELYRTALYPGISYLHAPQSRRYSLALDMTEPFKPLIVDRMIFRLFDRKEITDKDFRPHTNGIILTNEARKRILTAWDEQMRTTVHVPLLKRSVSYRRLMRLDCYKLIKFLIEEQKFQPYRINY